MPLLTPVEAPPLVPSPYGLFSLGNEVTPSDARWVNGFSVESRACDIKLSLGDVCDVDENAVVYDPSDTQKAICAWPTVPVTINVDMPDRSTFGLRAQDYPTLIADALYVGSQKALEYELWTGTIAQAKGYDNRYLASDTAVTDITPTPGTPIKVRYGQALLEAALGDCGLGTPGVLHMRRDVASALSHNRGDDGILRTPLGNAVIAGTGYPGTGPDGTSPTSGTWLYATGTPFWWLDDELVRPIDLGQAIDTETNTVHYFADRIGAVTFDGCCIFGVLVDLALDYA